MNKIDMIVHELETAREQGEVLPETPPGIRRAREMGKVPKSLQIMENFYRKTS